MDGSSLVANRVGTGLRAIRLGPAELSRLAAGEVVEVGEDERDGLGLCSDADSEIISLDDGGEVDSLDDEVEVLSLAGGPGKYSEVVDDEAEQ